MGDVFKEQLVAMKTTTKDKVQRVIIWTVVILVSIVAFFGFGSFVGSIVILAAGWGGFFMSSKFKKEHEYALTNNELDIDVIYNKERRKKVISIDLKKIDLMASIKDDKHKESIARAQKTIDASNGEYGRETYAILYPNAGQLTKILITPNEEMVNLMYKQAPHKVTKNR